jgi:serine/threonine-protein phosphatase 5
MVCHGGLPSVDGVTLDEIKKIDRFMEPPASGHMCDLLWADPSNEQGRQQSRRGVSMQFGSDVSKKFLDENKLGKLYDMQNY